MKNLNLLKELISDLNVINKKIEDIPDKNLNGIETRKIMDEQHNICVSIENIAQNIIDNDYKLKELYDEAEKYLLEVYNIELF